jgi:Flp pilus assembly protein TadD
MKRLKIYIALIIIIILTFVTFSHVLSSQFINLDDNKFITENPLVNGEMENAGAEAFQEHLYSPWYKPLVYLSWQAEYKLSEGEPWLFHLNNLLLHIINSVLAFFILLHLLKALIKQQNKIWIFALFGALLFALHPMKVESVAWAMERKDMLFGIFFLSGLLAYIFFIRTRKAIYLTITFCAYALGLLSKSMIIVFPLILFVVDIAFSNTRRIKFQLAKIPLLLLMLGGLYIYGVLFNYDSILHGITGNTDISLADGSIIEGARISIYERGLASSFRILSMGDRFFFPINLSIVYPEGNIMSGGVVPGWFVIFPLVLASIIIIGFIFRKRVTVILIGSLIFIIGLLPVLGMPGDSSSFIADRYTYIPSLGAILLICYLAFWFYKSGGWISNVVLAIMLILTSLNAYASYNRTKVFHDSMSLWNDVINKYPTATIAWDNRGSARNKLGDLEGAVADYSIAIQLSPMQASLYNNRGATFLESNQFPEAINDLTRAIELRMGYYQAEYNLGIAFEKSGQWREAYDVWTRILELKPDMTYLHETKGEIAFFNLKDNEAAINDYTQAIRYEPMNASLYNNRGAAYHLSGDHLAALNDYRRAVELAPELSVAWFNAGMIEVLHGDKTKGCENLQMSVEMGYTAATDSINKYCK